VLGSVYLTTLSLVVDSVFSVAVLRFLSFFAGGALGSAIARGAFILGGIAMVQRYLVMIAIFVYVRIHGRVRRHLDPGASSNQALT
jgi:hypothetical protein